MKKQARKVYVDSDVRNVNTSLFEFNKDAICWLSPGGLHSPRLFWGKQVKHVQNKLGGSAGNFLQGHKRHTSLYGAWSGSGNKTVTKQSIPGSPQNNKIVVKKRKWYDSKRAEKWITVHCIYVSHQIIEASRVITFEIGSTVPPFFHQKNKEWKFSNLTFFSSFFLVEPSKIYESSELLDRSAPLDGLYSAFFHCASTNRRHCTAGLFSCPRIQTGSCWEAVWQKSNASQTRSGFCFLIFFDAKSLFQLNLDQPCGPPSLREFLFGPTSFHIRWLIASECGLGKIQLESFFHIPDI